MKLNFGFLCLLFLLFLLGIGCSSNLSIQTSHNSSLEDVKDISLPGLTGSLSELEIQGLMFMREEEKLARDVYLALYDLWGNQIFSNIAASEQTHTDAVRSLIIKYQLTDPAESTLPGIFVNPELQRLYQELVQFGTISIVNALLVGGLIEEKDMIDITKYKNDTDQQDIIKVYGNLLEGSKNHLRAFVKNIEKLGINYTPQILSQEEFDEIINSK